MCQEVVQVLMVKFRNAIQLQTIANDRGVDPRDRGSGRHVFSQIGVEPTFYLSRDFLRPQLKSWTRSTLSRLSGHFRPRKILHEGGGSFERDRSSLAHC